MHGRTEVVLLLLDRGASLEETDAPLSSATISAIQKESTTRGTIQIGTPATKYQFQVFGNQLVEEIAETIWNFLQLQPTQP